MAWTDRLKHWAGFDASPPPPASRPAPVTRDSLWHASTRLIDLTGNGDWLTLGDCCTGLCVFGATGSGKTSSLAIIAHALLLIQCGFVWLCAKPDEVQTAYRIAAYAGREKDVIIIGEDINGGITRHRFNPLQYEASRRGQGTTSIATYLSDCAKILSRKEGEKTGGEGERFWTDQFERLLRYCIDTAKYAGRLLSVSLLREIQLSAPASPSQIAEEQWLATSTCWQCIKEAETRMEAGDVSHTDFMRIVNFWCKDWATLDIKPRSSIDAMFAVLVDAFCSEEPMRYILSGESTVTPDDVLGGKIVILSLPTNVYGGAGRMVQHCFRRSYQNAMLARRKPSDGSPLRPTVLWVDEAGAFAHAFDSQYFREVRSNRGICVYLAQGVGSYMQSMNFHAMEQVDDFLQNLATKWFFQNSSPNTNKFACDAIGRFMLNKASTSQSFSGKGDVNLSESNAEEERHLMTSGTYTQLQRGGPENNFIVSAIILRPEVFPSSGRNVAQCYFQQTDLTR